MKKIIALAVTMVAAVSFATAEITIGARGIFGLNVGSTFDGDGAPDVAIGDSLTFGGAVFANIPLVEAGPGALAIQPELGFTHNRIGMDIPLADTSYVSVNTIDIAALVAYNIKATDTITISPFLGPQFSIIAGDAHMEMEAFGVSASEDSELDTSVLVSLAIGAEAQFKVGPGAIIADLRYNIGFNGITAEGADESFATLRGLRLGVGYGIQF